MNLYNFGPKKIPRSGLNHSAILEIPLRLMGKDQHLLPWHHTFFGRVGHHSVRMLVQSWPEGEYHSVRRWVP